MCALPFMGILLAAIGSLLGAQAQSLSWLLFKPRGVEGGGWVHGSSRLARRCSASSVQTETGPLIMRACGSAVCTCGCGINAAC